jgi:hypothetical protein
MPEWHVIDCGKKYWHLRKEEQQMTAQELTILADGLAEAIIDQVAKHFAVEELGAASEDEFCRDITDTIRLHLRLNIPTEETQQ